MTWNCFYCWWHFHPGAKRRQIRICSSLLWVQLSHYFLTFPVHVVAAYSNLMNTVWVAFNLFVCWHVHSKQKREVNNEIKLCLLVMLSVAWLTCILTFLDFSSGASGFLSTMLRLQAALVQWCQWHYDIGPHMKCLLRALFWYSEWQCDDWALPLIFNERYWICTTLESHPALHI